MILTFKQRVEQKLADMDTKIDDRLDSIEKLFSSLTKKITTIMAKQADFQKVLDRIDTATSGIATEILALKDQVKVLTTNAGMDAAEEEAFLGKFDSAAGKLEGIGKEDAPVTPTDPTPAG